MVFVCLVCCGLSLGCGWYLRLGGWPLRTPVAQKAAFVVQMAGPVAGIAGGVAALFRPEAGPCYFKGHFFLREAGMKGRCLWHVSFFAALGGCKLGYAKKK